MLGTSTLAYVWIRTCIFFLHIIAPGSCLLCVFVLLQPFLPEGFLRFYTIPLPIRIWIFAEAAFFTVVFLPYKAYLQRSAIHPELRPREEREKLFLNCMSNVPDWEKYLRQWHFGANMEYIKRENLKEFFGWAFLNTGKIKADDEDEVEGYVRATEKLLQRDIPPGKGSAKSLKLTLDKVEFLHRSLLWYLCIFVVDTATSCAMWYNGFNFYRTSLSQFLTVFPFRPLTLFSVHTSPAKHLTYWHRPHTSKTRLPILFIHGIGVGLYPYTDFLRDLNKIDEDAEVGIIAIEIMPVSSRLTHPALSKDAMVCEVREILNHHGWNRTILVSHSYGSIMSTHLLKSPLTSHLIGPVIFVDPVSFLLHLPDVAYNFTARQPKQANEYLLWYFGSKDIGVAHTLGRRFFWSENIMWKEDLGMEGRDVTVVLSGKDMILNVDAIGEYLAGYSSREPLQNDEVIGMLNENTKVEGTKCVNEEKSNWKDKSWTGTGLEVLWYNQLNHGEIFEVEESRRPLIKAIEVYSVKH